ncbi:MAG: hypothetical protein ABFD46_01320 [Armatimonadota bacterium]
MRRSIIIFAALVFIIAISGATAAGGKLVLVVMGGVSLDEIAIPELHNISFLVEKGAIGIMNARPASTRSFSDDTAVGRYSMEGGCATIGAGTRAAVTTDARKAHNISDVIDGRPAAQLYESLYGAAPARAEVLHLGMNRLRFINEEARYPIEPGALGGALRKAGLKTAAVGNSDTAMEPRREAALTAADPEGIIDFGDVGEKMILHDPSAPYGIRTDTGALLNAFRSAIRHADFVVVDVGDTARASSYAQHCVDIQGAKHQRRALMSADEIVGGLVQSLDLSRDRIILVSPNPSPLAIDNFDFLPPVIIAGSGIEHGLLSSGSTHRTGIITNADITASVLNFFNIEPPYSFVGSPVMVCKGSENNLIDTNKHIMLQIQRQPMMRGLAVFLVAYVIVLSLYILKHGQNAPGRLSWAVLLPVSLMLAVLWLPAITNLEMIGSIIALVCLVAVILGALRLVSRSPVKAFGLVCGAVVATMIVDIPRGAILLRDSILSYTPVDGARYYGIGNEHMGSMIGAAMIGVGFVAAMMDRKALKMPLITVLLGVVVAVIGLPPLGANAGGAMSAVAAAVAGFILWKGQKMDKKRIIIAAASVLGALGLLVVVDSILPGSTQSHVGKAAHLIATGGIGEIGTIIGRKLVMNLMLLRNSTWSKLLIVSAAAVIAFLSVRNRDALTRLRGMPHIHSGVIAATVGTAAAFLLNDSGVVAAATAFIYVWTFVAIIYLKSFGCKC